MKRVATVIGVMTALLAAGCGSEHEELQTWMDQQRREVKPNVEPLSPPKKFNPQAYTSLQAVEPFSNQKLTVALKQDSQTDQKRADATNQHPP